MNCHDCEQLFDAFLDGELGGSLRLEFEAHRLRCPHCQQALTLLEAVGPALSLDEHAPALSSDFSDRVIAQLAGRAPLLKRRRIIRLILPAATTAVAACLLWIFVIATPNAVQPLPAAPEVAVAAPESPAGDRAEVARGLVLERLHSRLEAMNLAGREVSSEFLQLTQIAPGITLPPNVAQALAALADSSPWTSVWDSMLDTRPDAAEHDAANQNPDEHPL